MASSRKGKRSSGEGTIYERNGRFYGSVQVAGDRRWVSGADRKTVVRKIAELRQQAERGALPAKDQMTIQDFCERWLTDVVATTRRENTFRSYSYLLRMHVYPALGGIKLKDIRALHITRLHAELRGKKLSETSIGAVHGALHTALANAVELGEVAFNVVSRVKPPKRSTGEMQTLSAAQARTLLAAAEASGARFAVLWRFLLDTGCRIGEALGLRWDDVDLQAGRIAIRRTLVRVDRGGTPRYGEPKTAKGRRSITLTPATVAALRAHKALQAEQRLRVGADWAGYDLVFCTSLGTAQADTDVRQVFRQTLKRAELPMVRLHDLRHSAATILLSTGANPRVVADRLGHANVTITLQRYSHVTESMEADAAERMARALEG